MNASDRSTSNGRHVRLNEPTSPLSGVNDGRILPSVKLRPPKLPPALLLRPALLARLRQWRSHRLSVMIAPAGYGKTFLAASALPGAPSSTEAPFDTPAALFCWLTLDEDDDSAARFVQSLAASVAALIPTPAHAATLLALTQEHARRALLLLLAALEELAGPVLLVLDNYHRLHNPAVHDLLSAALEYTSDNVHWLILSRQSLPISLGRLRLQRQVLELNADDLRLSRPEIQAFLRLNHVSTTDAKALDLIEARTHGWVAALQLALLSCAPESDPQEDNSHADSEAHLLHTLLERLRGDRMLLAEYLAGEVLAQLNEPLRRFLMHCAILERLHPALCRAVTGVQESEQLLRQAVHQQLFLRPLDDTGTWYEPHSLFRDLLLYHLRVEESAAAVQLLYRRAADWYVTHGDVVGGLRALLAGGFSHVAAELVQNRAQAALLNNHLVEVQQWFDLLPPDEIDARPRLLLDLAWLNFMRGAGLAAILHRVNACLAALPPLPKPWQDEWMALTLLLRLYEGPRQNLHHDALAASQDFDPSSHLARGWTLFAASLLMNQAPGKPLSEFAPAIDAAFGAAGFARGQIFILGRQMQEDLYTAQVENVVRSNARVLELMACQSRPDPGDGMFTNFLAGEALYWQNRLPEAIESLRQAWRDTLVYQDSNLLLQVQAAIQLYNHATGATEPLLDPALHAHHWEQAHALRPLHSQAALVLWELRYGTACGAPQIGLRKFDALGLTVETLPIDAPDLVWLCLLTALITKGEQLERLTSAFELMLQRAHDMSSPYFLIQIKALQALQLYQLGRRNAARGAMRQLLQAVESTGYVRMVIDQPGLRPILQLADNAYAGWLLAQMAPPDRSISVTNFSRREAGILRLLAEGLSPQQIAEHLVLSRSTTRSYLSRLYAKLGVENHTQAVTWAQHHRQQ